LTVELAEFSGTGLSPQQGIQVHSDHHRTGWGPIDQGERVRECVFSRAIDFRAIDAVRINIRIDIVKIKVGIDVGIDSGPTWDPWARSSPFSGPSPRPGPVDDGKERIGSQGPFGLVAPSGVGPSGVGPRLVGLALTAQPFGHKGDVVEDLGTTISCISALVAKCPSVSLQDVKDRAA